MSGADPHITDFDHGISAIDTQYVRPLADASHLIVDAGEAAFVDTGTSYSVPLLLAALERKGLAREQVRYVCVTHVHLDHAGGAGELMRHLPRATLVAHPRGARHMIDPSKLIRGSTAVYGEAEMQRLYGEIPPVPAERVHEVADGEQLRLGSRELVFLDTPGHAYHHYSIHDPDARAVFSGDTFGLSYREFDTARGEFIFPTTTPVHFDPAALHASIDRLMALDPAAVFVTHYSRVTDLDRLAAEMHRDIDALAGIARRHANAGAQRHAGIRADMRAYLGERLAAHACPLSAAAVDRLMEMDLDLNTQGLEVWLDRQAA
ncbi:MAG TPA: MBL fold metallo-hydrolase [Gammaproteobacteria bacterium]|nr:MBL fold metallo-hydrolase [Gammaproteobacteria bacterium]